MLCRTVMSSLWLGLWLWSSVVLAQFATLSGAWPQFRGPQRDAVSSDTGLLTEWPENGPPLMWKTRGAGRGYSSVAIVGDRLYTLGDGLSIADDQDEYVVCFALADGALIWKTRLGAPWTSGRPDWQSSRSTPTVDGDLLYILTPHGDLVCLESATGRQRWRKNMVGDLGGRRGDQWGYSESVLIDGQRLICTPGGETAAMVALDKMTGDVIWRSARPNDRGAGHASVVISEVGGTRVYVNTTASGAFGVRAEDGRLLWTYDIDRTTAVIPTPIIRDDLVFFTAGYRRGGALLRQVPQANGTVTIETVYPLNTELSNKHGGVVLVGDHLYGDSDDQGIPFCAELMTGQIVWKERGPGRGSAAVAAADGHLYIRWASGAIALVEATPEGYRQRGSFQIPGSGDRPSWSHPVIVGGRLVLREGDTILCYDVSNSGT
jgi:outer membrane protein assembly factor BamB